MDSIESITARLETTDEVRSVVRTMKSLSAASIHGYERARDAVREYERTVELGLQIVLRSFMPPAPIPAGSPGREMMIVIGSDRGLCGRFNDRIASFATARLRELRDTGEKPYLAVAGRRAAARLEAEGHKPDILLGLPGSVVGLTGTVRIMTGTIDRWLSQAPRGQVSVAYNRHGPGGLALPQLQHLVPISVDYLADLAGRPWASRSLPIYQMDRSELLSWLFGEHLFIMLYKALAESLASEHASRLAAMESAQKNLDERLTALRHAYRMQRQQTITRELLEVVTSYEMTDRDD